MQVHFVHDCLPLKAVALGDNASHVLITDSGSIGWSGISKSFSSRLKQLTAEDATFETVSLGRNQGSDTYSKAKDPEAVWFLGFTKSGADPGNMTTLMGVGCEQRAQNVWWGSQGEDIVIQTAFAPSGGWYVWRQGGGARWEGLPDSLKKELRKSWDKEEGVQHLSVGHNGEWFVLYNSGSSAWDGLHPTLHGLLKKKKIGSKEAWVEWVELGPDGSFVALFDSLTVWCGSQTLSDHMLGLM